MRWSQVRRSPEGLPFFANEPKPRRLGLVRSWRSIPRLIRTVLAIALLCFTCAFTIIIASPYLRTEEELPPDDVSSEDTNDEQNTANGGVRRPVGLSNSSIPTFSGPTNDRQRAVVDAFKHAWAGYRRFAWGHDQLRPVSGGYSDWFDTGLTIVDALDTAIIMNLKEEVAQGTEWIRNSLSFEKDRYVNLFETTIRTLGGLLSAFHLTGDRMFVDKAEDLAGSDVNLKLRKAKPPPWSSESSLSEVTSLQLEFRDLSRVTGKKLYEEVCFNVSKHVHEIGCNDHGGLCDMFLNANTGYFRTGTTITFGARTDSYYEYLLKQWIQTGKTIDWLLSDYVTAMNSMQSKLLRYSEPNKLAFVGELLAGTTYSPKMDHLVCFLPGTLALGSHNGLPPQHMELAKELGKTCQRLYVTPTGLAPEIAHFNMLSDATKDIIIKPLDAHSLLRPEAVEAWFYLYRITGDKIYQDWGWEAFKAIEKYAKVRNGYSSVKSVNKIPVAYRDLMESFFLAETLKYLYLLFADDQTNLFPLDKWVFNTEAHPLPIYSN
ncbi:hypothetical protein KIN20_034230 [Parelaphostrongylus tenuis]|uniref:alpha-1,2-Mannosidase n=1 Tax=Parelaphostrongylus tenuis TaxID=148309 RepID=A0AAD5R9V4_PARTN|nr:hypothetical protein KIN20_034230 [Parelaphostrongylus tenuis]